MPYWISACAVLLLVGAPAARAQDSTCTYDRCALRLRFSFWSTRVVRGALDSSVASIGPFVRRVPLLAASPDTAVQRLHAVFQADRTRATVLGVAGIGATIAALIVYNGDSYSNSNSSAATGLLLGGFGLALTGAYFGVRANDDLSAAIWRYNRRFAR